VARQRIVAKWEHIDASGNVRAKERGRLNPDQLNADRGRSHAADPLQGLAQLIDAAISLGAREHNLLTAARRAGSLTPDVSTALYDALNDVARRGQRAGVVRADLAHADLPRMIAMLHSVLWTMDSGSDGWRRYIALMLDAISVDHRRSLPPAAALRFAPRAGQLGDGQRWRVTCDVTQLRLQRRYLIVTYSRFARKLLPCPVTN
jgi:hypothetical protein